MIAQSQRISGKISTIFGIKKTSVSLNKNDIILGNTAHPDLLNLMILLGKQQIHFCKINNTNPSLRVFTQALKNMHDLEMIVFQKGNEMNAFKRRWIFAP